MLDGVPTLAETKDAVSIPAPVEVIEGSIKNDEVNRLYRTPIKTRGWRAIGRLHWSYSHPLSRAIRAASMRFEAPSFKIASER